MTHLYKLTADYAALQALAELDEVPPEAIADTAEGIAGEIEEKGRNIGFVLRNLESEAQALRDEEQRLARRRRAIEANAGRLRELVVTAMATAGIKEIACPHFRLRAVENPPSVAIHNEEALPDWAYRVEVNTTLDKKAIAQRLRAGEDVPGAALASAGHHLLLT